MKTAKQRKQEMEDAAADADFLDLAAETLKGDIRDFILDRLKNDHRPQAWHLRSEMEQRTTVHEVERAVGAWVYKACQTIAADGRKVAKGTLVKLHLKDGIQVQINFAASDPMRHEVMDHVGSTVLVALVAPEEFSGERAPVKITPDQKTLIPDDDGGSHDHGHGQVGHA